MRSASRFNPFFLHSRLHQGLGFACGEVCRHLVTGSCRSRHQHADAAVHGFGKWCVLER